MDDESPPQAEALSTALNLRGLHLCRLRGLLRLCGGAAASLPSITSDRTDLICKPNCIGIRCIGPFFPQEETAG